MENQQREEWRWVIGYEDKYMVSSLGRVKSFVRKCDSYPRILSPFKNKLGYLGIHLMKKPKKYFGYLVHRLVAQAFIPNPENKPHINHKNFITSDARVENLEWVTPSENMVYTNVNNPIKSNRGEKSHFAKLTLENVIEIRNLRKQGKSGAEIAKIFNISGSHANMVARGSSWKYLKDGITDGK